MTQAARVLIVDDKEAARESIQLLLSDFDCVFSEAEDGIEALDLLGTHDFDVVFLDLKLPDRSGIEVLRTAKIQRPLLAKVIIVTGLPSSTTRADALELGVFRYLTKPLAYEEIRSVFSEATHQLEESNHLIDRVRSPEPANLAPIPPADDSEQRYVEVDLRERFSLSELVTFTVRIAASIPAGGVFKPVAMKIPQDGLTVTIFAVGSDGLDAVGPSSEKLTIYRGCDSDWLPFRFKPKWSGTHIITLRVFDGGKLATTIRLDISVESRPSPTRQNPIRQAVPIRGRGNDEVSLAISYAPLTRIYRYNWIDSSAHVIPECESQPLEKNPHEIVESIVAQINQIVREKVKFTPSGLRNHLSTRGVDLWNQLIPYDLQKRFWGSRERTTRITFFTDNDPMLWELLYPYGPGDTEGDAGFLIEQVLLTRWGANDPPPQLLGGNDSVIVTPQSNAPATAEAEASALSSLFGRRGKVGKISELDSLLDRLDTPFDILHFACHNTFTSIGSRINFGTGFIDPASLRMKHLTSQPLVFINACRTEGHAETYTNLTNWAKEFIRLGAGAFIGSLWEVRDGSAARFAEAFYRELLDGRHSIAVAMRRARDEIKDSGDPTWLAYTLYADPTAVLKEED